MSNEDDLMAYFAAVKNSKDVDRLDVETRDNFWLKGTPGELRKKDITASDDSDDNKSVSYSSTTYLEGYMNDMNLSSDLTDTITTTQQLKEKKSHAVINTNTTLIDNNNPVTILDNTNSMLSTVQDTNNDTNNDDSFGKLHGNIYTLDDLVTLLPSATNQQANNTDIESSQESTNERDNPLSNLHMIEDLDQSHIDSIDETNDKSYNNNNNNNTDDEITDRGNLMSLVHNISELENSDHFTISESFVYRHSNDFSPSGDLSTSFEDQSYIITHSQQDGEVSDTISIERSHDKSHDHITMREGSHDISSEMSSLSDEYDYSIEFDTPDNSSEEDKECNRNDTADVTTPSFKQQTILLKNQSSQTERVLEASPINNNYLHCSPLLPYIVKQEELEVLSAYTPATVALQDLLRSQLALTERLVNQSRTLSVHMSANITANYQYVTLDQTKQYISSHKPRVLSFEEALKRVKKDSS